ncbi:hypothetical protein B0H13DRAFT_1905989 [Mycena leptocephala]|nr:hypothetical protein B0H13DRAFT_1905989 [Mycena leptocephala]
MKRRDPDRRAHDQTRLSSSCGIPLVLNVVPIKSRRSVKSSLISYGFRLTKTAKFKRKLAEEKSPLELALETKRQQCDEQQRKNTNLTEEYERERKMGSELRTALEERYLAIRTVESDLEERRRTFDRDLEDLTREKEAWGSKQVEHERALEEIGECSSAEKASLLEKHRVIFVALASKNSGLVRTLESKQAECTAREQKFQAVSTHAASSQAFSKEALRVSNGKIIAKQADLDKLQQHLDTLDSESSAKIKSLAQELRIATDNLSTSQNVRAVLTLNLQEDSAKIQELQRNLDETNDRRKRLVSAMKEILEGVLSQARAATDARDQLAQDLEHNQANQRRLSQIEREPNPTKNAAKYQGPPMSFSPGELNLTSSVPLRKASTDFRVRPHTPGTRLSTRIPVTPQKGHNPPPHGTNESETQVCLRHMSTFTPPSNRPRLNTLSPIGIIGQTAETQFLEDCNIPQIPEFSITRSAPGVDANGFSVSIFTGVVCVGETPPITPPRMGIWPALFAPRTDPITVNETSHIRSFMCGRGCRAKTSVLKSQRKPNAESKKRWKTDQYSEKLKGEAGLGKPTAVI